MAADFMRIEVEGKTYRGSLIPDYDSDPSVTYAWARITPPFVPSPLMTTLDVEGPVTGVEHYATTQAATILRFEIEAGDQGYNDTYNKRVQSAVKGLSTIVEILNDIEHDNDGQWA